MTDNIIDIFDRYGDNSKIKELSLNSERPKSSYSCFEVDDIQQTFLKFGTQNDALILMSYAYLAEVILHSDRTRLDLLYKNINRVEVMIGSNLENLIDPIQAQSLRSIQCFIDTKHIKPKNGEILVTQVHGISLDVYYDAVLKAQNRATGQHDASD